jgi:hypothetical protein
MSISSENDLLLARLGRRRRAFALERGDTTGVQLGIGDWAALELHALGPEGGIAVQHLLIRLAPAYIRSRTWIWWGLGRGGCREGDQQCRGWYRRYVAGHLSVPPSEATRLAPQSAIVKPPLTLSTWPVM